MDEINDFIPCKVIVDLNVFGPKLQDGIISKIMLDRFITKTLVVPSIGIPMSSRILLNHTISQVTLAAPLYSFLGRRDNATMGYFFLNQLMMPLPNE